MPLDEDPRPKSGKLRLNLINWRENQLVQTQKKKSAKRRALDLDNQE